VEFVLLAGGKRKADPEYTYLDAMGFQSYIPLVWDL